MIDCLVVGGDSPIGSRLVSALAGRGLSVTATSRRDNQTDRIFYDLETQDGLGELPSARFVALVAAETRFQVCNDDPEKTHRINVDGAASIARQVRDAGSRVLFFSSIAVHNGAVDQPTELSKPIPKSQYGRQKLDAENHLIRLFENNPDQLVIVRPSKVITPDFALFTRWIDGLTRGEPINAFSDMVVAPIWIDWLVDNTAKLLSEVSVGGIFQFSAQNQISYVEIATELANLFGVNTALVKSVKAGDLPSSDSIWLPRHATLDCRNTETTLGTKRPNALEAIRLFADNRKNFMISAS